MMFARMEESLRFRFLENAMPAWEKRRSTEADDAGQPRYCRAITSRLGNFSLRSIHHSVASLSVLNWICGSARDSVNSSVTP